MQRKQGFTLIELLVVIAIIAILAAILFPVFAKAREKARQSSCLANLKQISLGVLQYVQDFDEGFPIAGRTPVYYSNPARYVNLMNRLDPYLKSHQLTKCPSDQVARVDLNGDGATEPVSYAGTWYDAPYAVGAPNDPPSWGLMTYITGGSYRSRSLPELEAASETVLLMEQYNADASWEYNTTPRTCELTGSPWANTPPCIRMYPTTGVSHWLGSHNDVFNVSFADGHGKALKENALLKPKNLISVNAND